MKEETAPRTGSSSLGKQKQRASCTESSLAFLPVLFCGRQASQPSSHFLREAGASTSGPAEEADREWGVKCGWDFLGRGIQVDVTPGLSKHMQTLNVNSKLLPHARSSPPLPSPSPSHNPTPWSIAAVPIPGSRHSNGSSNCLLSSSHNPNRSSQTYPPHSYPGPILSSPAPIPTLNSNPDPSLSPLIFSL